MQKNASGKKKIKIVEKPILTGRPVDVMTGKRVLGVAGGMVGVMFIYLIFGSMLMFDNLFLRLVINTVLVVACGAFLYMNGATHGEADAAFGEIMYQREAEGNTVPDADRARCFMPAKGAVTALLGAVPFVLLALAAALTAKISTYALGALPDWLSSYRLMPEVGDALRYYESTASLGVMDIVRLVVRVLILPFVSMVGAENVTAVLWMERLSPLLALLVPAGYGLGYVKGKQLRARVHTSIAQSKRRKKSKDKKERQKKQQKGPEQLI